MWLTPPLVPSCPHQWPKEAAKKSESAAREDVLFPAASSTAMERTEVKMFPSPKKIVSSPRCFVWFKKKEKSSLKILQPGRRNPRFVECLVTAPVRGTESMHISPKWQRHFNETRRIWELNSIPLLGGFNAKMLRKLERFFSFFPEVGVQHAFPYSSHWKQKYLPSHMHIFEAIQNKECFIPWHMSLLRSHFMIWCNMTRNLTSCLSVWKGTIYGRKIPTRIFFFLGGG